jgi:hypothetical protein
MTVLRFLNAQGIAGIAVSLCLALLLVLQKDETRHWKAQSGTFEQLYRGEQSAFAVTVANYRDAANAARAADLAAAQRAAAEQQAISQRSENALESRLADARARAERMRLEAAAAAADPGSRGAAPMPGLPITATGAARTAGQDRLPLDDALTATEQAIQLDELIRWVKAQAKVDSNGASPSPQDSR